MQRINSSQPKTNNINSPIDLLIEALEASLLPRLEQRLSALIQEKVAEQEVVEREKKRLYSLQDLARVYGVGRDESTRLIKLGSLRCVERRCRGGRMGIFVPREEAELLFAGVKK